MEGLQSYYFVLFFLAALSFVFDFCYSVDKIKSVLCLFLIFVLSIFAGTRIGWSDQVEYALLYHSISPLPQFLFGQAFVQFRVEFLFLFLSSILKCFSDSPLSLFLLMAFITVAFNLSAYKKYSPYFFLAVVFYFSNDYFEGAFQQIRMGVAGALILFSMSYLVKKRWKAFYSIIIVACFFQISSVFAIFGYFLYRLKLSTKSLFLLLMGAFVIGSFSSVTNWLFSFIMKLNVSNSVFDRGWYYLESQKYGYALGVFRPTMLKQVAVCLVAMGFRDFLTKRLKYFDVLFIFYCASTMWRFIFNDVAIYSARGGAILGVGEPVIMASLLLLFKPSLRLWMAFLFVLLAFGIMYLNTVTYSYPKYMSVLFGGSY